LVASVTDRSSVFVVSSAIHTATTITGIVVSKVNLYAKLLSLNKDLKCVIFQSNLLFKIENLVLPPGCRPYGPEAGPGQR
jgi:hypothetical protein